MAALRDERMEGAAAGICEFFCYLALFLDIWEGLEGMLMPEPGEQESQAEPVVVGETLCPPVCCCFG